MHFYEQLYHSWQPCWTAIFATIILSWFMSVHTLVEHHNIPNHNKTSHNYICVCVHNYISMPLPSYPPVVIIRSCTDSSIVVLDHNHNYDHIRVSKGVDYRNCDNMSTFIVILFIWKIKTSTWINMEERSGMLIFY